DILYVFDLFFLCLFFFLLIRLPPMSTFFPYTTLFRSRAVPRGSGLGEGTEPFPVGRGDSAGVAARRMAHDSGGVTSHVEDAAPRSEEHTSELQSRENLVCRLLLEKKNYYIIPCDFS